MVDRDSGDRVSTPGTFTLLFTNGVDQEVRATVTLQGQQVLVAPFPS